MGVDEPSREFDRQVGAHLRSVRKLRNLSLHGVEEACGLKASIVSAYERGERTISVVRLQRLARLYQVPVGDLLVDDPDLSHRRSEEVAEGVCIDLSRVELLGGTEWNILNRYLRSIRRVRQDYDSRVVTIRDSDVRLLALMFDIPPTDLHDRLIGVGSTPA